MDVRTNILLVDDKPENIVVLEAVLSRYDYNLVPAKSGEEALELLHKNNFAVILLDVRMPGMDGFETATVIKRQDKHQFIPIIFISASYMDGPSIQRGYEVGGVEYIVKPFDPKALQSKVSFFVSLYRKNLKSEEHAELERSLLEQERLKTLVQLETKSKKLQETLNSLQAEKDLRERFVATLAHDLRNPITAAKMSAQLIERHPETTATNRKRVRKMIISIDRADQMIQDLLDANRISAGEKLPMTIGEWNMTEVVREAITDLITVYGDRFKLEGPGKVEGFWYKNGIRRIIENLISNAVKYGDPHKPIGIFLEEDRDRIRIKVHNEGNPLSADQQKIIFEPYKRGQAKTAEGWGLGLTLVRGIAEAHNGKVEVQSSSRGGTTFTVTLPKDARQVEQAENLSLRD